MKTFTSIKLSLFLIFLFGSLLAKAITSDIVVALDGSGDFTKIQAAIDAVPSNQADRRTVIFIKNGLYDTEKLIVPANKINISIIGESRDQTIISYHIYDCSSVESGNKCPAADALLWTGDVIRTSATFTIMAEGFRAENLTIQNTAGPVGQALALTVQADKTTFVNCNLLGYQDTIYLWTAGKRTYFQNCLVLGRTDYIYGAGIGYFEACEIRSYGGGYITAPSTPQTQPYGFVFNHCNLTYTDGSPRAGDDGTKFRFGRPWHEYPKVCWINCSITGMLNPQGWGDTWNMPYSSTSTDLHLYEYNNSGEGANMSQRASWAGLRAISSTEALNYTREMVLNGSDNWAPWADAPLATTYTWNGNGNDSSWVNAANWDPNGVPSTAEAAYVVGPTTVVASGGLFQADLHLQDSAVLLIRDNSTVAYLSVSRATLQVDNEVSLAGKIATKDSMMILTHASLHLTANLQGVHPVSKIGPGNLLLSTDNSGYSGSWHIVEGQLTATTANCLGKSEVVVNPNASLQVDHVAAFNVKSALYCYTGSQLVLNENITLSEFYLNDSLMEMGTYNASTHPALISGLGTVVVGRPSVFKFAGGVWDNAANYSPALLPLEGEVVECEGEMETATTINKANVRFLAGKGKLRLRGVHASTGTLTFEGNQRISYATSGTGFALTAPIVLLGDISLEMNSSNVAGNSMVMYGSISGASRVTAKHTRDVATTAKVVLGGDNSTFHGIWDISSLSANPGAVVGIVGGSENAFGSGEIRVGAKNVVQFDHAQSVSAANELSLAIGAKAILNTDVVLGKLTIANETFTTGVFGASSHPVYFEGAGTITLSPSGLKDVASDEFNAYYRKGTLILSGNWSEARVFKLDGGQLFTTLEAETSLKLPKGVYLVSNNKGKLSRFLVSD